MSFGRVRRRQLRTRLVERLRRLNRTFAVFEDHVYINVACGSVSLDASIVAPDAAAAAQLQIDVQEQVLANSSLASEALGETVAAVGVASVGEPLIIDAPSPPPAPPPSPTAPPQPPESASAAAPPAPVKPLELSDDRQEETPTGMDPQTLWIVVGAAGGGGALLCLILSAVCCGAYCGRWTRRRSERHSAKWSGVAAPRDPDVHGGGAVIPGIADHERESDLSTDDNTREHTQRNLLRARAKAQPPAQAHDPRRHTAISFDALFDGADLVDPMPPPSAPPGGERI